MKKSLKIILIVILMIILMPNVKAFDKELVDPDANISIPIFISKTGSKINIYDVENYDLYYQWVELSNNQYAEINASQKKCNDMAKTVNDYLDSIVPNRDDYDTVEEYNEKVKEYNQIVKEKREEFEACQDEYYSKIPNFDDSKWIKTVNDTVYLIDGFTGTKSFVMFVKLYDKDNNKNIYDYGVLEIEGDEAEQTPQPTTTTQKATTTQKIEKNPSTSDLTTNNLILIGICFVTVAAFGIKKVKKMN